MNDRDRVFLNEGVQFTHLNRVAIVYLLRQVLGGGVTELEDLAFACLSAMKSHESADVPRQSVRSCNDAADGAA